MARNLVAGNLLNLRWQYKKPMSRGHYFFILKDRSGFADTITPATLASLTSYANYSTGSTAKLAWIGFYDSSEDSLTTATNDDTFDKYKSEDVLLWAGPIVMNSDMPVDRPMSQTQTLRSQLIDVLEKYRLSFDRRKTDEELMKLLREDCFEIIELDDDNDMAVMKAAISAYTDGDDLAERKPIQLLRKKKR